MNSPGIHSGLEKTPAADAWLAGGRAIPWKRRALIMGILNVTPDSFSDGGRYLDRDDAVARGVAMVEEGADILDVGGESTRPGAEPVDAEEEAGRVVPVIAELSRRTKAAISVDTAKAEVAIRAIDAGACIVNDITALADPAMTAAAVKSGAGVLLMHMQGTPRTMQANPQYADVVAEVTEFLRARVEAAVAAGVRRESIAVDPGIGFGKTVGHNVRLLSGLPALVGLGRPVVVGVSRKSFLGKLTGRDVHERLAAGLAALAFCRLNGAHVFRVHDVAESKDAARLTDILRDGHVGMD